MFLNFALFQLTCTFSVNMLEAKLQSLFIFAYVMYSKFNLAY